jgi:hypothetical protein
VPEKRSKAQIPGIGLADVVEVAVTESTERWTDVKLEDGTEIRVKPVIVGAARVENQYDPEGNPLYQLRINQVMTVTNTPDHLRKNAKGSKDIH